MKQDYIKLTQHLVGTHRMSQLNALGTTEEGGNNDTPITRSILTHPQTGKKYALYLAFHRDHKIQITVTPEEDHTIKLIDKTVEEWKVMETVYPAVMELQ